MGTFIPYANPDLAAASMTWAPYQYPSIVPFQNNPTGINAAYNTDGYQSAAVKAAGAYPDTTDSGTSGGGGSYDPSGTSGGGYGSYSAPAPAPVVNNQPYIDIINGALGRIPGQEAQAENQIHQTYDTKQNELQSGYDQSKNSYNQSTTQNGQQFVANKNQINNQASNGLTSLLRVLGSHGAGGSSAAQFGIPNAVAHVASQQRSGADQTFGQNQQALDTNFNNYQSGFDNSKKQLSDWLGQQVQGAQSNSEQTRQGLLQQLLGLQPTVQAAQPFVDQINASANKVDELSKFNPTYDGKSPVYNAPSVASYTVNSPGSPTLGTQGNNTGASSPALQFLLSLKDKQQQPSF